MAFDAGGRLPGADGDGGAGTAPRGTSPGDVEALADLLRGRRVVALTGAGLSTESGIPDYRGPGTRRRARNPVRFQAYVGDPAARRRYWARAAVGWPRFSAARPNAGHRALAAMEAAGRLRGVITQNVDRLHQAAGARRVVELHGALAEVVCLACRAVEDRAAVQARLLADNPGLAGLDAAMAPDGDAELESPVVAGLRVPVCLACGGALKPHVVFFGENVPRSTVDAAFALFDEAEVLLVAGSSLAVFSGYRFVRHAAKRGAPVAIVNRGETRGDPYAALRVDGATGAVLPALAAALTPGATVGPARPGR